MFKAEKHLQLCTHDYEMGRRQCPCATPTSGQCPWMTPHEIKAFVWAAPVDRIWRRTTFLKAMPQAEWKLEWYTLNQEWLRIDHCVKHWIQHSLLLQILHVRILTGSCECNLFAFTLPSKHAYHTWHSAHHAALLKEMQDMSVHEMWSATMQPLYIYTHIYIY